MAGSINAYKVQGPYNSMVMDRTWKVGSAWPMDHVQNIGISYIAKYTQVLDAIRYYFMNSIDELCQRLIKVRFMIVIMLR